MTGLALASLRHRATTFTATFLAVFLGALLIGAFAMLAQTSTGGTAHGVSDADAEVLGIMGFVVGSWGSLIVLFSVASALGIATRQRAEEIGVLRVVGATPRQARRLVLAEAAVVSAIAAVLGALAAWPAGAGLLALLRGRMVADSVEYGGGVVGVAGTAVLLLATSLVAAAVTARRTTKGAATLALADARSDAGRMPWWRVVAGLVLVGYGLAMAVVTVTVAADADDPYIAMQTSGSSCVLVGVGLGVLSPLLLRWMASLTVPLVARRGASGWLAAYNTSRRPHLLGNVLAPVIVLTASSVGVLMLVGIDHRTIPAAHAGDSELVNLLNNVVTGMIVLFAGVMVVNAFAAVVAGRRQELQRLRLIGATRTEVERSVLAEAGVVAAVGVILGLIASLATVVPFAIAREEGVLPNGQLWLPPLLAAAAVAVTLGAAALAVRRAAPRSPLAAVGR